MTRVATMVARLTMIALLGSSAARAQGVADACLATQSQLAQKRADLAQVRMQVARLNDAVNTYREGIEFQRQNATEGVLDTILAEASADAKVAKATTDSAIAWMAAAAPVPLKPAATAVQKTYEAVTGGIAAAYEFFDGQNGKATGDAFGAVSKGLEAAEAFRAKNGLVPTTWEGPGHSDYTTSSSKAMGAASGIVKGANALQDGKPAEAVGQTLGAVPNASLTVKLIGKGSAAASESATAEDRAALALQAGADIASELKEKARDPRLSGAPGFLSAGATTARAEKDAFDGLDKGLDSRELRQDIRDRATVTEAQFTAKMRVKAGEEAEARSQLSSLELEVATLELQHSACAPPQLFAGPGDTPDSRYASGNRGPAASTSYRSSVSGGGLFGGAFGSIGGQHTSPLFPSAGTPSGAVAPIPGAAAGFVSRPARLPTPPPLQGRKPAPQAPTGPRPPSIFCTDPDLAEHYCTAGERPSLTTTPRNQ